MHAYLLIGQNPRAQKAKAAELVKKLKIKAMEFPLAKIEDTREIEKFTRLTIAEPTAIILNSIEEATEEALNAFLKNLEEPQENLYFILTATSLHKVLPTVASRCQIIKLLEADSPATDKDSERFLKMEMAERLAFIEGLRAREEAVFFVSQLITHLHQKLIAPGQNKAQEAKLLALMTETLSRIKANGNVSLQLTNMVANFG